MNEELLKLEHDIFGSWILRIYYANIAMNNESIKKVIQEIASTLHISEGEYYDEKLKRYAEKHIL